MEKYFQLEYEFDKTEIHSAIAQQLSKENAAAYICVADGVVLTMAHQDAAYRKVVNESLFCICDSSWATFYIKWIYGGERKPQYCGSDIFSDIIKGKKYRMCFLGSHQKTLNALQNNLEAMNPDVSNMLFYELPFKDVEDFNYPAIASMIEKDGADIIWISLGAPKQDIFMNKLKPYLRHGVMIGVGAAFSFYSGIAEKRAPKWMIDLHLEFLFRIISSPKKQTKRCWGIITTLPKILSKELKTKKTAR